MYEFARQNAWLIPALPLLSCVVIGVFGRSLKARAHWPAWLALAGSFLIAITLLAGMGSGEIRPFEQRQLFEWFSAGAFRIPVGIKVDELTAIYLSFVTGISLLIFIYAAGYMKGDYGYWRFFAHMSIFVFFMCTLVMGNNFVMLYLGWEGVGLASYLLIGYYYPRPSAVAAAKKAFIVNRVGDFGLAIGIFLIYLNFGSVEYTTVFAEADKLHGSTLALGLAAIPFCLMLGAFGKSAQFPLHVWLPDAMEGPTPVSALIHAATMVTAGIYLIARTMPLFLMDDTHQALMVVACVGGFTAFLSATIALCQYDLKRIWAYSTLSQLGYMFLGLGVLAGSSAVFHVVTHAFFKALLFLSAGSVMHAMGGELDIRKMSGVKRVMPITRWTMLIGCMALAGVPGLAGFFSKDEILAAALNSTQSNALALGILAVLVALLTAYYTFRLYFRVFEGPLELPATAGHHEPSAFAIAGEQAHGEGHGAASHATPHGHEQAHGGGHTEHAPGDGSRLMWVPLVILSAGAVLAGYMGVFGGAHGGWFGHFARSAIAAPEHHESAGRIGHATMMVVSGVIALAGIGIAWYFHLANRAAAAAMAARLRPVVNFLYQKWYIDHLYHAVIVKPLWILAHLMAYFDRYVIDSLVFLVGFFPQLIGYSLRPTQRGILQRYAVGMVAGLAAIVLGVLYFLIKNGN